MTIVVIGCGRRLRRGGRWLLDRVVERNDVGAEVGVLRERAGIENGDADAASVDLLKAGRGAKLRETGDVEGGAEEHALLQRLKPRGKRQRLRTAFAASTTFGPEAEERRVGKE